MENQAIIIRLESDKEVAIKKEPFQQNVGENVQLADELGQNGSQISNMFHMYDQDGAQFEHDYYYKEIKDEYMVMKENMRPEEEKASNDGHMYHNANTSKNFVASALKPGCGIKILPFPCGSQFDNTYYYGFQPKDDCQISPGIIITTPNHSNGPLMNNSFTLNHNGNYSHDNKTMKEGVFTFDQELERQKSCFGPIPSNLNQLEPTSFMPYPCQFPSKREEHNAKERKRRNRIKVSCEKIRNFVPGLHQRTDKATVFEGAVRYICHLKSKVGEEYDELYLKQIGFH